ncbi:hypothetical protein AVEN_180472-1 [Araneus ventricosus]|uniref:Uncharacterized protein n=1 Tax=Araneus ventricosus TaxID=182803 RepID=A0A4Y2TPB4_ARAVE|nr:hypothetical protein AVEN_180472-1 [Araneus ventricosus]
MHALQILRRLEEFAPYLGEAKALITVSFRSVFRLFDVRSKGYGVIKLNTQISNTGNPRDICTTKWYMETRWGCSGGKIDDTALLRRNLHVPSLTPGFQPGNTKRDLIFNFLNAGLRKKQKDIISVDKT